ncbi:hypothetical protein DFJ74DRAFT_621862 [Hyaloraphidium curvatum]|nr:hypothetical protein DFJ74DRAFT_621862 [Hyaloraphidium curvatum]
MSDKLRSWWSGTFGDGTAANGTKGSSGLHATVSSLQPVTVPARRRIFVNLPQPDSFLDAAGFPSVQFPSNEVSTAKYSIITFLPKNLWEQFHRIANVFFLAMAVSQVFPVFQVTNAFMPFVPLVIVLTLTALKDGWEDYKRHKSDKELNNSLTRRLARHHNVNYLAEELDDRRPCFDGTLFWKTIDNLLAVLPCCESCLRPHMQRRRAKVLARQDELLRENHGYAVADAPSSFSKPEAYEEEWPVVTWSDLRVGDFVFLRKNDLIPADVVVLSTSDPDNLAYVETKNLDGETNLKSKVGPVDLRFLDSAYSCRGARFWLDSEGPNLNLYTYSGVIMIPTAAAAVGDGLNSLHRSPLADPAVDMGAKGAAETSSIPRGVPLPEHAVSHYARNESNPYIADDLQYQERSTHAPPVTPWLGPAPPPRSAPTTCKTRSSSSPPLIASGCPASAAATCCKCNLTLGSHVVAHALSCSSGEWLRIGSGYGRHNRCRDALKALVEEPPRAALSAKIEPNLALEGIPRAQNAPFATPRASGTAGTPSSAEQNRADLLINHSLTNERLLVDLSITNDSC